MKRLIPFLLWASVAMGQSQTINAAFPIASGGTGTLSLVQGPTSCGVTTTSLTLTAAATASGGATVYSTTGTGVVGQYYIVAGDTNSVTSVAAASGATTVYTGIFPAGGSNAYAGFLVTFSAFAQGANNGIFLISASTTTTLTVDNAQGVIDTTGTASINVNNGGPWIATAVSAGTSITLKNPNGVAESFSGTAKLASCNIANSLTSGNLYVFGATGFTVPANPGAAIYTVTANNNGTSIGTLVTPPMISGQTNTSMLSGISYVLPSTSLGATSPLTCVFSWPAVTGSACVFVEIHPSANPANVGLDLAMALFNYTATTTPAGPSGTLTGTSPACIPSTFSASTFSNLSTPFTTAPFITHLFQGTDWGLSYADSSASVTGTGPTWTYGSSLTAAMYEVCFSYNPTAGVHRVIVDWSAGTAGNEIALADIQNDTFGAQPGTWTGGVNTGAANKVYYFNSTTGFGGANPTPFVGLVNTTPRFYGDGVTHSNSSPHTLSNGIYLLGTGGVGFDSLKFTFKVAVNTPMTMTFPWISNAGSGSNSIDFASVSSATYNGGSSQTVAAINAYTTGTQPYMRIEAAQGTGGSCGNSASINVDRSGTVLYNISLTVTPGVGTGSATLHVKDNTNTDITGSPVSVTGCNIFPIYSFNILGGNSVVMTNGAWMAVPGPMQLDFTGAIPLP